jgi:hypothetical protein
MKILIIGHARHGKDTVAELIRENYGLNFKSSSQAASDIYDELKDKYGYETPEECFADRVNHRAEWHDLICGYNYFDKARLAKEILLEVDMYVGMRSNEEVERCLDEGLFDLVVGVFNPDQPLEDEDSFDINLWEKADLVIPNAGTLEELEYKVTDVFNYIIKQ